jgi:hypothetical protein
MLNQSNCLHFSSERFIHVSNAFETLHGNNSWSWHCSPEKNFS